MGPQSPRQAGDKAARPARQLEPLLRQTKLPGQELRALLAQGGEPDVAAQRQALLEGLRRAQQGQALCCELPEPLAEALASLLPRNEQQEQQGAAPCTPVVVQAQRLARQLSQLAWEPGQPLAVEQASPSVERVGRRCSRECCRWGGFIVMPPAMCLAGPL